jgi:NTE family protein
MRVLVLSGGHALGAYQGGAWEALAERGFAPDWVAGTSIGAINGALILGGGRAEATARLRRFWELAARPDLFGGGPESGELRKLKNAGSAAHTFLLGRPGLFNPQLVEALTASRPALYQRPALPRTLRETIDFEALNRSRFTLNAVDAESGEERLFEAPEERIGPEHLMASSAFLPDFEPEPIGGRRYADGSHATNAPIDRVLEASADEPSEIVVVDLFAVEGESPRTPDAAIARRESITFGQHVERALRLFRRIPRRAPAVVLHLAYRAREHELASRGYDYAERTLAERWAWGREEMARLLDLAPARPDAGAALTVRRLP